MKIMVFLWAMLIALVTVGEACAWSALGVPGVVTYSMVIGAILADAWTPLGVLNFCVLQWFGVRVVRVVCVPCREKRALGIVVTCTRPGWCVMRWIWPLTGWWTDYRWIARRS